MATSLNQDDYQKTALRLPRDLHSKIVEAASVSGRSMNAEIVSRLEQSYKQPPASEVLDVLVSMRHDAANAELDRHMLVLMVQELALYVRTFSATILGGGKPGPEALVLIADWTAATTELAKKASLMLHSDLDSAVEKFEETTKSVMERGQRVRAEAKRLMSSTSSEANDEAAATWNGDSADAKTVGRSAPRPKHPPVPPKPRRGAKK